MPICGLHLHLLLTVCFFLASSISLGLGTQWYEGCAGIDLTQSGQYAATKGVVAIPATCCAHCYHSGHTYAGVGNDTCWCGDGDHQEYHAPWSACNKTSVPGATELPCGGKDSLSIYKTEGPYLLHVRLSKGQGTIQTGTTTLFDAKTELASNAQVSTGIDSSLDSQLENVNFTWLVNGSTVKNTPKGVTNTSSSSTLLQTFSQVGTWQIAVNVSNPVSSVTASTSVHVVRPVPSELQVILRPGPGHDIPSCVPAHDHLTAKLPAVAVFINEVAEFQAYLSIGVNLTFDWWFEDDGSHVTSMPYLENRDACASSLCLHNDQVHVFHEEGLFTVTVNASNALGSIQKTLHVVVMNRGISNLSLTLSEGSFYTTPNTSLIFQLDMETANREQALLSLNFADGTVYNHSLRDVNETFIRGGVSNPANMYLTASYGDGCQLRVSFSHKYSDVGEFSVSADVFSNGSLYTALLPQDISVQKTIPGVHLQSESFIALNSSHRVDAVVHIKTGNMSFVWRISHRNETIMEDVSTADHLELSFSSEGQYVVEVIVKNLVSEAWASKVIGVQRQIAHVDIQHFSHEAVVLVDTSIEFMASTEAGTHPTFLWNFLDGTTFKANGVQDQAISQIYSRTNHTFSNIGIFNVTVTVYNHVSSKSTSMQSPIWVQEPVSGLEARSLAAAVLGNTSGFLVSVRQGSDLNFHSNFDGNMVKLSSELLENGNYLVEVMLSDLGLHVLNISASNNVSEKSIEVKQVVQKPIGNLSVTTDFLSDGNAALLVHINGETDEREDVVYHWTLHDRNVSTTSRLFVSSQLELTLGNVSLVVSNLVDEQSLHMESLDEVESSLITLNHSYYVEVKKSTPFSLSLQPGYLIQAIRVSYKQCSGIHEETTMTVPVDSDSPAASAVWERYFPEVGLYMLNLTLETTDDQVIRASSVISVQEVIEDIRIRGQTLSTFVGPTMTQPWEILPSAGSSFLYTWEVVPVYTSLSSSSSTSSRSSSSAMASYSVEMAGAHTLAYLPFSSHGTYNLTLTASNQVSSATTSQQLTLREPIRNVTLSGSTVLHGLESSVLILVQGGPDFRFDVDFGDGSTEMLTSRSAQLSLDDIDLSSQPATYAFTIRKVYSELGDYVVSVLVDNGVSSGEGWTTVRVEERITGLHITTQDSWLVNLVSNITLVAMVATGNDVIFTWDFNDLDNDLLTKVIHSNSSYSEVVHAFSQPGEYSVSIRAHNALQPQPVIYTYPTQFVVQQVPLAVELHVEGGASCAPLTPNGDGWITRPLLFMASSWGSHINFYFSYGDGTLEFVPGLRDEFGSFYGYGRRAYTEEGEYAVSVAAGNHLMNLTQSLREPFIVEVPPSILYFSKPTYTFPFGNESLLHVHVDGGSNLFFNWSMGDQTNFLFHGPTVSHVYLAAGSYQVTVVAFNKVQSLQTGCQVDVLNRVSFVELNVERQLGTTYRSILFTAVTPSNSATWFEWDMGNNKRIATTSIGTRNYTYINPGVYYISVIAGNSMTNATSNPLEMVLQAEITKPTIRSSSPTVFGQSTTFEIQVYSGSDIEYEWDFGDGSPVVLTNQVYSLHTYDSTGEYFATVQASNDVSNANITTSVFIVEEPCTMPVVDIVGDLSRMVKHSEPISVELEVYISCEITEHVAYTWTFTHSGNGSQLLSPGVTSFHRRTLFVPARIVPIGHYTVTVEVRMNNTIVYTRKSLSLTVEQSSLVAVIEGGTTRTVDDTMTVFLNGGFSFDLDQPSNSDLSYNWMCYLIINPNEPCFEHTSLTNVSTPTPSTNESLLFPASWLRLDQSDQFVFVLTVSQDGRESASASQVITVTSAKVYEVLVDCPSCDNGIVNSNSELMLEALCPACGDNMTFVWELLVVRDGTTTDTSSSSRCYQADGSGPLDLAASPSPVVPRLPATQTTSGLTAAPMSSPHHALTDNPGQLTSQNLVSTAPSTPAGGSGTVADGLGQGSSSPSPGMSLSPSVGATSNVASTAGGSQPSPVGSSQPSPVGSSQASQVGSSQASPVGSSPASPVGSSQGTDVSTRSTQETSTMTSTSPTSKSVSSQAPSFPSESFVGESFPEYGGSSSFEHYPDFAEVSSYDAVPEDTVSRLASQQNRTSRKEGKASVIATGQRNFGGVSRSNVSVSESTPASSSEIFPEFAEYEITSSSSSSSSSSPSSSSSQPVAEEAGSSFAEAWPSSSAFEFPPSSIREEEPSISGVTTERALPTTVLTMADVSTMGINYGSSSVPVSEEGSTSEIWQLPSEVESSIGDPIEEDNFYDFFEDTSSSVSPVEAFGSITSPRPTHLTPGGVSMMTTHQSSSSPPTSHSSVAGSDDNTDHLDIGNIHEQDSSANYYSIQLGDDTLEQQSSQMDGDPVANPDETNTFEEHIALKSRQPVVIGEEATLTGLKGPQLVLREGMLEEGRTYAVAVKIYQDGTIGNRGEAYQYVTVNRAPKLGVCDILPSQGIEMDTPFFINCNSWQDDETPLRYEIRYSLNQSDRETILYYGMDFSVSFLLPAGHQENNYNVYLKLAIVDNHGGKTSVCDIAIPVLPKEFQNLEEKLQYLDEVTVGSNSRLGVYVAHGDQLNIHSHVRLVAQLLNDMSHDHEAEMEHCHNLAQTCSIRSALLEALKALSIRDQYEILQAVGALMETTIVPEELSKPCQVSAADIMHAVASSSASCKWAEPSLAQDTLSDMVTVASSLFESYHHNHSGEQLLEAERKAITETVMAALHSMLQVNLDHMTTTSDPVTLNSPLLSVQGSRLGLLSGAVFAAGGSTFSLPDGMVSLSGQSYEGEGWTRYRWNYPCFDAHAIYYQENPFVWNIGSHRVTTPVTSLELFSCNDPQVTPINVTDHLAGQEININIDNSHEEMSVMYNNTFDPAYMNVHEFNVTEANILQSMHISILLTPIHRPVPITVLLRYNVMPTPSQYDLCWNHDEDMNSMEIFLPPDSFNVSGRYFLALMDAAFNEPAHQQDQDQTRQYMLNMWWAECLYWDTSHDMWSPEGCVTSSASTFTSTQCRCTHLSSFGVSFLPVFSTLSLLDMQLFAGTNENPVTYMFVGVVIGVYIMLFVFCYYADCHDEKKQGLIFLDDNHPGDQQYYDITVETGFRTGAGTTARISIVLHGDEGHSETKELISHDKPIFERNSRDRFIISCPESLGNIQRIQLWHNNAGLSPSWYLSRVSIRDLLTGQKWFFICERWFAVEEEDGRIERELYVEDDGVGFTKAFFAKGAQYFADYYIWSSIFTRPPYSVFTRVQRLTCCLCISMGFMCINTLWYQKLDKEDSELGVIDLSGEAVLVGIVTALIAIPINFPLIMIFRRSRSLCMPGEIGELYKHIKSPNKHKPDPEEQTAAQLYSLQQWAREKWKKRHKSSVFKHLSENESSRSSIDGNSLSSGFGDVNTEERFGPIFTDSDLSSPSFTASLESLACEPVPSMDHKKLTNPKIWLPHFFFYVAWGWSLAIITVSAIVTIVLGLKFTTSQAIYWMQSLYFSFLQCIFVTQPCVMAMFTICKAWKHRHNIKIFDHYDDNTDLIDKKMLRKSRLQLYEQDMSKAIAARQRSRYLRFARPPQPKDLKKAKEEMLKKKHMYAILRDVILFLILLFCLLWMAYGKHTSQHHAVNESVSKAFLKTEHPFSRVRNVDDLWEWLQQDMMDALYWSRWYNGERVQEETGSVKMMGETVLLGKPSLRQVRVRPRSCRVPPVMRPIVGDCEGGYSGSTKTGEPYGPGDGWVFRTARELRRYCKWGMFTSYEGEGYAVDFNNTRADAMDLLGQLRNNSWIDAQTRAVILEFTLYNTPYNLFSAVAFVAEMPGSGAIFPLPKIESVELYRYEKMFDYFIMSCELLFVLLVAVSGHGTVVKAVKQKAAYFHSVWAWVEMSLIFVSLIYFAMYVCRFAYVSEAGNRLRDTYLEEFVDLSFLAWWDQRLRDLIGLILFIVTLKFLNLLRFNRMFAMFGAVFEAALGHTLLHLVYYLVLETAYGCLGNQLFGRHYYPFKDAYLAYEVMTALIVGSAPDHSELWSQYPVLWPLFYVSYFICMIIIMAGLMKGILCLSYRRVKHCPLETVTGQEVVSFFWQRFLCWLGIRKELADSSEWDKLPMEFTMAEIQYQVDELVFRMNAILHQNGLPDKPFDYLDDSDATQPCPDDGISSYPSEEFESEKFEERVQRLEEQLYQFNPELRDLLTNRDDPERHQQLRAKLELEIFRQLQLSRQQDLMDTDDAESALNETGQSDSGQITASGSLASISISEEDCYSALSCVDMREAEQLSQAAAFRKDDGQVAFPQPMRNLGTLEDIKRRNPPAVQAWAGAMEEAPGRDGEHQEQPPQRRRKSSHQKLLSRFPRPHTAAVFPVRTSPQLSGEDQQDFGIRALKHKESNTSMCSSGSAGSQRTDSDGCSRTGARDCRSSQGSTSGDSSRRNSKITPFTRHGWAETDLNESQTSSQNSCPSHHSDERGNPVQHPSQEPSRTHCKGSGTSLMIVNSIEQSVQEGPKKRRGHASSRPRTVDLVQDHPSDEPVDITLSLESFPLPNTLEQLDSDGSEEAEANQVHDGASKSHKRRKGREAGSLRPHRLRKTRSRGKGKGKGRLPDDGQVNQGYMSDSNSQGDDDNDDHIPVIQMSKIFQGRF